MNPDSHRRYQQEREHNVLRAAHRLEVDVPRRRRHVTPLTLLGRRAERTPERPAVSES